MSLQDRLQSALGSAYRVESELGGGGMSRVFLADEVRLGRRVVVKVLPPELAAGVSAERFEREIQLAAKLQHPHIVPLLTAGAKGDLLYYVMPHIAGESLRARIAHERALPIGETVRILHDVCDALAYAHAHGVVHRDVKPADELLGQLEAMATPPLSEQTAISSGTAAAIRRSHPVRIATLFGFAAFGVLTLVNLLVRLLGLPDWAFAGAVGLAAAALPFMLWTGAIERRRARAGVPHWLTWRRSPPSAASGFGLLGLVTATHAAMRQLGIGPVGTLVASGVLAERDRLVLADFENRTKDSTLGPSLTEALRVDLAQSGVIRLLDEAAVGQALLRMGRAPATPLDPALARDLAQREGAKAVVHGQIDPLGRGYVVSAELVGAADGAQLAAVRETARDDGAIIDAVDRLSRRLRERIR